MSGCPHDDKRFCPLYVAAHVAGAGGCDDGKLGEFEGCAVDRGKSFYDAKVCRLRVSHPGLVEDCEWRQDAERLAQQRSRNLRSAGIH